MSLLIGEDSLGTIFQDHFGPEPEKSRNTGFWPLTPSLRMIMLALLSPNFGALCLGVMGPYPLRTLSCRGRGGVHTIQLVGNMIVSGR